MSPWWETLPDPLPDPLPEVVPDELQSLPDPLLDPLLELVSDESRVRNVLSQNGYEVIELYYTSKSCKLGTLSSTSRWDGWWDGWIMMRWDEMDEMMGWMTMRWDDEMDENSMICDKIQDLARPVLNVGNRNHEKGCFLLKEPPCV